MITPCKPVQTNKKIQEIKETLAGYWENDKWYIADPAFDWVRPKKWNSNIKSIDLTDFPPGIKEEIKFYIVHRLRQRTLRARTVFQYSGGIARLGGFLSVIIHM